MILLNIFEVSIFHLHSINNYPKSKRIKNTTPVIHSTEKYFFFFWCVYVVIIIAQMGKWDLHYYSSHTWV